MGLIDRLCAFLQQDDAVLFTCGYSFGDNHINERIVTSLRCQVFRVGANSENDKNELCVAFWALPFKELMAIFPTMIALSMTNTRDKGHVSSAMQDELREMTEVLSSLRTGEAIVSGEAVRIPSRIKFYQADNAVKSSDPIASKLWANASPEVAEYETSVRNWRNQSFTQGGNSANP